MKYVIRITKDNGRWQIIDHYFTEKPTEDPIIYTGLKWIDSVSIIEDLGSVNIQDGTTGSSGTGELLSIN